MVATTAEACDAASVANGGFHQLYDSLVCCVIEGGERSSYALAALATLATHGDRNAPPAIEQAMRFT
jgi:hypothetical protein